MKKKKPFRSELPLADMHTDGVRFDQRIKTAKENQKAEDVFEQQRTGSA